MTLWSDLWYNLTRLLSYTPGSPMLFSSGLFWGLFLIFLPIFSFLRERRWQMIVFVLLFSLYFYYRSSGMFVLLLICTSLVDWLISRQIARSGSRRTRRWLLVLSLTLSLGVLGYFKYANFFLWNFAAMVGSNFQPLELILPVGISFYTFQSVSYVVDVYKGRVAPTRTWLEYAFFLSFFPALVAGPIVRADYFLPQIHGSSRATRRESYTGLWLIMLGVAKKAIFADYLSQYNDLVFDSPGAYSGFETMMGIIGYTMQIYCDFSGYSDMAIGLALIMGFKLAANFNFPYKSRNLTEFWHRWHISLSSWLRDYVYIPLGGNRKGTCRTYVNNFVTMLIGGLWHGAGWKFVFWGAMHGVGLAIHKAGKPWLSKVADTPVVRVLSWLLTITVVMLLWVYFRADSFAAATAILAHTFSNFSISYAVPFAQARSLWLILLLVIVAAHALPARWWDRLGDFFVRSPWPVKLLMFIVLIQCVMELRQQDVNPFIYFQF